MDSNHGKGLREQANMDAEGPLRVTEATTLTIFDQDVLISNAGDADYDITLPPVAEAHGRTYSFYKTDSATQSVFVRPNGWINSSLESGDSLNFPDVSDGYDFDAQYDHLVLYSNGVSWIQILEAIA